MIEVDWAETLFFTCKNNEKRTSSAVNRYFFQTKQFNLSERENKTREFSHEQMLKLVWSQPGRNHDEHFVVAWKGEFRNYLKISTHNFYGTFSFCRVGLLKYDAT